MKNKPLFERLIANWPVKALSLAAAVMLFLFHNFATLSERYITVPLTARFAQGYTAAQTYPRKVRVVVRAAENKLSAVSDEDLEASIDFSQFSTAGFYRAPVVVTKKGLLEDLDPVEIRVEPLEVGIEIEKKVQKQVEVIPSFKGFLTSGYGLEQYSVNPPMITVEGPTSRLQSLTSLMTEEIDLSAKTASFTSRVRVVKNDPLLYFSSGDTVEFKGFIQEAVVLKSFDLVSLVALDLRPDLRIEDGLPQGQIRVQGGQILLDSIGSEQIRLTVDASMIKGPGSYTLPVKADVPAKLLVLKYDPMQITLNVRGR